MSNDRKPSKSKDYKVGYGRPPKETQFKPGQSGNPKGRKKKPKSIQDQMRRELARKITVTEGGVAKRVTLQEVCLRAIANKAAQGDLRALKVALHLLHTQEFADQEHLTDGDLSADDRAFIAELLKESDELIGEQMPEAKPSEPKPEHEAVPTGERENSPPPNQNTDPPPLPPPPKPPAKPIIQNQPEHTEQPDEQTTSSSSQTHTSRPIQKLFSHE